MLQLLQWKLILLNIRLYENPVEHLIFRFVAWFVSGFVGGLIRELVGGFGFGLVVVFGFAGVLDISYEARVTIDVTHITLRSAQSLPPCFST